MSSGRWLILSEETHIAAISLFENETTSFWLQGTNRKVALQKSWIKDAIKHMNISSDVTDGPVDTSVIAI